MKAYSLMTAVLLLGAVPAFAEEEKKETLTLDSIPATAAGPIRKAAGDAPVKLKAEKEDGVQAFEAKWEVKGTKHEITVQPDGTVISEEEVIALDAAPAPVKDAVKALSSAGELEKVEKITAKGVVSYGAAFETKEGKLEVKLGADGKELSRETAKKHGEKEEKEHEEEDDDGEEEDGD